MIYTYASHRTQPNTGVFADDFKVTPILGPGDFQERNFYVQYHNRAGRSLLSNPKNVSGAGFRVRLDSNLIREGEEVFWIVISSETTGNPEDAAILTMWQARENDQVTLRDLPVVIELTEPEHFIGDRVIQNVNDLPNTGILNGAIALVADTATYYRYDAEAYYDSEGRLRSYGTIVNGVVSGGAKWIEWYGTNLAYIESTTDLHGSDVAISAVEHALEIPPKPSNSNSTPLRYWFNNGMSNDGGSPVVNGRFTLDIAVNGEGGYSSFFSNRFIYYLRGYVDRETGFLDRQIEDEAGDSAVDIEHYWRYGDVISLPQELPRNHAAVYDFVLTGNNDDFIGRFSSNITQIQLNFVEEFELKSKLTEMGRVLGSAVLAEGDRLLVVPSSSGLKRLGGSGVIVTDDSRQGFLIESDRELFLYNLPRNAIDRIVAIAGSLNGLPSVRTDETTLEYSEAIRAYFSTVFGSDRLDRVTSETIQANNATLSLTVTHPLTDEGRGIIRSTYPDPYIAGNTKGDFTPTHGYFYLTIDESLYRTETIEVEASDVQKTQTIEITSTSELTTVSTPPVQSDDYFGLFAPEAIELTATDNAGNISGTVWVTWVYTYPAPNEIATKIKHDVVTTIPTLTLTFAELAAEFDLFYEHLRDTTDNPHQITTGMIGAATQVDLDSANQRIDDNVTAIGDNSTAIATNIQDIQTNIDAIAPNTAARIALRTAANKDFGTSPGELVELQELNGVSALPAVDGSQLTGIDALFEIEFVSGDFTAEATTPAKNYLIDTSTAESNITLPEAAADKSRIAFSDRANNFGTNNGIITPASGDTVNGEATFLLDFDNESVTLVYDTANNNWVVINGIQSNSTATGDMSKSQYDTDDDGIVDTADAIATVATTTEPNQYYGTNSDGLAGVYALTVVKNLLESLTGSDRLSGSAIDNFKAIANAPVDRYVLSYDLASDAIIYTPPITNVGAGAILIPSSQSLFEVDDGTVATAYAPDVGDATFTDAKILTTADTPDTQIVNQQLVINTPNTGLVLDLGISDTVLRVDWIFNTGDVAAIILRYDSDGNMNYLELSQNAIALKSVVADTITTVTTTGYAFTNGTSYKIEIHCIGVTYKVLIDDAVAIAEGLSNEFLTATKFGLGKIS